MEESALCRAQADVYRYLAAITLGAPGEAAVAALRDPGNRAFFGEMIGDPRLAAALAELGRHEAPDQKALADEFHALFIVPGPRFCTPNESVFLDLIRAEDGRVTRGLLWGAPTLAVRAAYARAGYELEADFGDLPDHIGAELLFVARLYEDEGAAWSCGDRAGVEQLSSVRAEFVRDHLGRFAPLLCARVEETATHAYFRAWAALLRAFVAAEFGEAPEPARAP